ncbi:retropepsin-like aspartic protease family protein [Actimicrobium antarcticum]|uniref:TIGR02281 family clan AA aspartic protease n=1 Tax=Actimicrobium antarcticum TaxID=1051899 RepID=A0ABP7TF87_9BURK
MIRSAVPTRALTILAFCLSGSTAWAESIGVVGLFPGKAVLILNGAAPRTYTVGTIIADGLRLTGASDTTASFDDHGKRLLLGIGTHASSNTASTGSASVTLQADGRGHFMAQGKINGLSLPMLVDTGASMITLSSQDARRLGIDYKSGQRVMSNTANGAVPVYLVRINSVRVGDIELSQVDALVQEQGLPFALLGMSFLNRTTMQRDGEQMVLTKRY